MRRKNRQQKGFTLVELLIAMGIFVLFTGVVMSSYTSIIRSQREANSYREMYSEGRRIFVRLTEELRAGSIVYKKTDIFEEDQDLLTTEYRSPLSTFELVSENGERLISFEYEKDSGKLKFIERRNGAYNEYYLNEPEKNGVKITDFYAYVSPAGDPYNPSNVFADSLQFHPKVTVYAAFSKPKLKSGGENYTFDLQTTVSSRLYVESMAPPNLK